MEPNKSISYFEAQFNEIVLARKNPLRDSQPMQYLTNMAEMLLCQLAGIRDELAIANEQNRPEYEVQVQIAPETKKTLGDLDELWERISRVFNCGDCQAPTRTSNPQQIYCLKCQHKHAQDEVREHSIGPDPRDGWEQTGRHG